MKIKSILLLVVVITIIAAIWYLESAKPNAKITKINASPNVQAEESSTPELMGISGYLNTNPGIKIADFRGKVVLIDFWTYTCINCLRTLPHLTAWDTKYRDKGLVIIGVHTPEFEFEKKHENVKAAVERLGIKYPVVQDNDYATWKAFRNRYWPAKYLLDKNGNIRYTHFGEGKYEETEDKIRELLMEVNPAVLAEQKSAIPDQTPQLLTTPELYLGYTFALPRGQNIGNKPGLRAQEVVTYALPEQRQENVIYLEGAWKSNPDNILAEQDQALLSLRFTAAEVNVVADADKPVKVLVLIDGKSISPPQAGNDVQFQKGKAFLLIYEPKLYTVVKGQHREYELQLYTESGLRINAFTFG